MGNDHGHGQTTVSGALGGVEGVLEDAHGNRLNFRLTFASSGPRVIGPQPPPRKISFELASPDPEMTETVELMLWIPQ